MGCSFAEIGLKAVDALITQIQGWPAAECSVAIPMQLHARHSVKNRRVVLVVLALLPMKFTDGNWMMQPGVQPFYPAQTYLGHVSDNDLELLATHTLRHRGDTLDDPTQCNFPLTTGRCDPRPNHPLWR